MEGAETMRIARKKKMLADWMRAGIEGAIGQSRPNH